MISLFSPNSNKVINKLANRSIKADKQRNIFIIITITFAACLMVSFGLYIFGGSYKINEFLRGRYQAAVLNINEDEFSALSKNENIETIGLSLTSPLAELHINRDRLNINYFNKAAFNLLSYELIEGYLPEKETEIAVPSSYLEKLGINPLLGQVLSLDLGNNIPTDYTVCGLIKDDDANNVYDILVSQSLLEIYYSEMEIPYSAMIRMAESDVMDTNELKQYILACLAPYGFDEMDIAFSSSYFTTFDNVTSNSAMTLAISVLIVIACSTVIYSLFYISVTGKIREYGRLRVVGITQKQIKQIVRKEGLKLSLLSIPAGIILGCIIGYLLVPDGWYWPNTIRCALTAAIFTEIAVLLSIRKPMKIAASVSPIEAIRITTTTDTSKFNETKKLSRKISPYVLAKINFTRNRKKTALTLLSLSFTGIFLMCTTTIMLSINPIDMAYQELGNYELSVYLNPQESSFTSTVSVYDNLQQNNPLDQDLIHELSEKLLTQEVSSIQGCTANIFMPNNVNIDDQPYFEIIGLSREYFDNHQDIFPNGSMNYDELVEKNGIIIDDSSGVVEKFAHYKATVGDTIKIETDTGEKLPFTVMETISLQDKSTKGNYIFVPLNLLNKIKTKTTIFNTKLLIRTDLKDISQTEDILYQILGDNQNIEIRSISEVISFMEQSVKIFMNAIYGVVILISIFALINLINTFMTNLISRQQEYVILQSIGLSSKQLSTMIQTESFCYVLSVLFFTLIVGSILGYILCLAFSKMGLLGTLTYTFPFLPMLVFFAILTLIAVGYSILAIRYCKRKSMVEYVKMLE